MEPSPLSPSDAETEPTTEPSPAFSRSIDWVIGGVLALLGLVLAFGGWLLNVAVERQQIEEIIREGEFQSDFLTEAEAIDLLVALTDWGGIGLAAAGISLVLLGVAVIVGHGRARRDSRGTPNWILGVVGAIVSTVLGFIPFSPIIGGAAASYLSPDNEDSGIVVGTFAGLFTLLPILLGQAFLSVGLLTGLPNSTGVAAVTILVAGIAFTVIFTIGLSAIGGYIGRRMSS